jgi:hypothetical protein
METAIKTELSENCPICGENMEEGYFRCLEIWGWGWVKEKNLGLWAGALKHTDVETVR